MVGQHVAIGGFSDGPQMRRNLIFSLAKIHVDYSWCIDWVSFVWIYDDTEETRVSVDQLALESGIQVVEDRCLIQIGQVGHIFAFFKLRWVSLTDLFRFENFFLNTKKND